MAKLRSSITSLDPPANWRDYDQPMTARRKEWSGRRATSGTAHAQRSEIDAHADEVLAWYGDGLTQSEIASRLSCSRRTVYTWLKKHGVVMRSTVRDVNWEFSQLIEAPRRDDD